MARRNKVVPVVDRDPARFGALYDAHAAAVYSIAYGILRDHAHAQDVVQDVFTRLWRRPSLYDPTRGEVGTLLRVMARTHALDARRRGERSRRAQDHLESVAALEADGRNVSAAARSERAELVQALRRLPQAQREALVLAYWGGFTIDEIARHKSVPLGTVKSRVRLGLTKLRAECEAA